MKYNIILFTLLGVIMGSFAAWAQEEEPDLTTTINEMRLRAEDEEGAVRVIMQPLTVQAVSYCTPAEQARQRVRDLRGTKEPLIGDVTVEAGHGDITIEDNSGTIDTSVNVQLLNPGHERKCF